MQLSINVQHGLKVDPRHPRSPDRGSSATSVGGDRLNQGALLPETKTIAITVI